MTLKEEAFLIAAAALDMRDDVPRPANTVRPAVIAGMRAALEAVRYLRNDTSEIDRLIAELDE
jgi:hypothetical protein